VITIATGDLTGVLSDVIPFASKAEEIVEVNAVRLEWDGHRFHALATDRYRLGWSQWDPDDEPDGDAQDDLFTEWGGADDPWGITLSLADAKDLVTVFKLPAKEWNCPLTLDYRGVSTLQVARAKETGYSALTATMNGIDSTAGFPDLRELLAKADRLEPLTARAYSAKLLADFAKVRPRGNAMEMKFAHGLTHVVIGERFTGAIMHIRQGGRPDTEGGVER
jgi:hypothetical protein